ncbi:MAG: polyphosphate kinase 2 [Paracoccaceae bacterium]
MTGKPFDGAISAFFETDAPQALRDRIAAGGRKDILNPAYPYSEPMPGREYRKAMAALQIELVKLQSWIKATGERVAIVFEGRDAAGKGGTIKRFRENLNPRGARLVALPKPTETERTQWYFQRYIRHLPGAGEIGFFDRSWYNRAVIEHVFGFCTPDQRALFFDQAPEFERMLASDGIRLFKVWLTVGRAEQLRRFMDREADPLKQWKLSAIDVKGLHRWQDYTDAIDEMFQRTHVPHAPWTVIRSDDKRRARLAAIRTVLNGLDYDGKDPKSAVAPDPEITGIPEKMGFETS